MSEFNEHLRLLLKAFSYLGASKLKYLLGFFMGSAEMAILFATPYINQKLINDVTEMQGKGVVVTILWMIAVFVTLVPLVVLGKYLQYTATAKGLVELREKIFSRLLQAPCQVVEKHRTGDYITRLMDDANKAIGLFASYAINNLLRFIVVFSITLLLLVNNDIRIAIAGVLYGMVNLLFSLYLNPKTKQLEYEAKQEIVNSASFLLGTLRGLPVVRVFNLKKRIEKSYLTVCEKIREKRIRFRTVNGITYGVVDFFAQSAQAVGFILGVILSDGSTDIGEIVFNASLMGMMGDSVYRFSTFLLLLQPRLVSIARVDEIMQWEQETEQAADSTLCFESPVAIELNDVCYSYDDTQVISNLSLSIKTGTKVAIVGKSGSGKSTLAKILEGIYTPTSGKMKYFGISADELSLEAIRSSFAYVPQEIVLLPGSIKENIAFGNASCSFEDVQNAAKVANIHDFIDKLPLQYDTEVGELGGKLSGGQRQRISIARAILRKAPILLLDEATSALDVATETEIMKQLDNMERRMTTIIIAHKLNTIVNVDKIFVIDKGTIVEQGSFADLMQADGAFADMYKAHVNE